jgi:hypothetical protein
MKLYRLSAVMMIVLLCLTAGLVLAQDAPDFNSPDPFFDPPTVPLNACAVDNAELQACDVIASQSEDIMGVWTVYWMAEPAFIRYNADGTWVIADTAENTAGAPVEGFPSGTYSFDADGVFTSASPKVLEIAGCEDDRYVLHVIKVGEQPVALNHVVLEDCFAPRRTDWAYAMLWVSAE